MNEILKKLRKLLGMSQKDFAEKLNISRGAIAQIEAGNNNVSFEIMHKIKQELNIDLTEIIIKEGYLYNKANNKLLAINEDETSNLNFNNDSISTNDLSTINKEYGFFPDIDIIKSYLTLSENQLKNILSNLKTGLREKITTSNNISLIANQLLSNRSNYQKHRFDTITEKEYMKKMMQEYDPSTTSFENVKLKWIALIYQFESENENISFVIADKTRRLKRYIDFSINTGIIKLNESFNID